MGLVVAYPPKNCEPCSLSRHQEMIDLLKGFLLKQFTETCSEVKKHYTEAVLYGKR
jgi:hypothetical protein